VRLLLDTHAFLWWLAGDVSLSERALAAVLEERNAIFVSAASTWEIATKHRLGKLNGANAIAADLAGAIESQGFLGLSITTRHGQIAGALPGPHRDSFNRMLIAQSMSEDLVLVSNERGFDAYGVQRLW
jgi:PIN domain nuclease of toxin-antitoxin system